MLINLKELAALLQRSPETIRKDISRNPGAVPPRVKVPRVRLLRWRERDVEKWLAAHVEGDAK